MTIYETENRFLLRERSVFAIISYLDVSCTILPSLYLIISPKKHLKGAFLNFFYLHADERGKTRSIFHCQTYFLCGREVKLTVFRLAHVV